MTIFRTLSKKLWAALARLVLPDAALRMDRLDVAHDELQRDVARLRALKRADHTTPVKLEPRTTADP